MIASASILTHNYKKFEMKQMYYSPLVSVNNKNLNNIYGFISYAEDKEETIFECTAKETVLIRKCVMTKDSKKIQLIEGNSLSGFFVEQKISTPEPFRGTKTKLFESGTVVERLDPENMTIYASNVCSRDAIADVRFIGIDNSSTNMYITLGNNTKDEEPSAEENFYTKYLMQLIVDPKEDITILGCNVNGDTITCKEAINIPADFYATDLIIKKVNGDLLFSEGSQITTVEGSVIKLNTDALGTYNNITVILRNTDIKIYYDIDIIKYNNATKTITVDKPFDVYPPITTKSKIKIYHNSIKKPLVPNDTDEYIKDVHSKIIYMKKISAIDISPVIDRIDWIKNYEYDYYDNNKYMHSKIVTINLPEQASNESIPIVLNGDKAFSISATSLTNVPNATYDLDVNVARNYNFYAKNSYSQVFKCVWNNNDNKSTEEPVFFPGNYDDKTNIVSTSDGYKWKYMYTISADKIKFVNAEYMPVPLLENSDTILQYGSGGIEAVNVKSGGSGYDVRYYTYSIEVIGDGTGAELKLIIKDYIIQAVSVANPGKNYTTAELKIIATKKGEHTYSPGSGAELTPIFSPIGGSGHNLLAELGCEKLMITSKFAGTESIPKGIHIRQFGLILNPKEITFSGLIDATKENYVTCSELGITEGSGVINIGDEFIQSKKETDEDNNVISVDIFSGICAHYETGKLFLVKTKGQPISGKPIKCQKTGVTRRVTSVKNSNPDILPFSGDIIYIQNTAELARDENSEEFFKIILTY